MKTPAYTIHRRHPAAVLAMLFMTAAAVLRLWYYTSRPLSPLIFWVYLLLPLAAAMIFLAVILLWGQTHARLTAIPVLLGVAFFIVKALSFPSLTHTVLCITLYTAVLVLYTLTVWGIIPTKKLLYPLFGLPLLYHIFVEDMQKYVFADPPVPVFEWIPEISVLCIMAALLCVSVAMKKKNGLNLPPHE